MTRPITADYSWVNVSASTTAAIKAMLAASAGFRHRLIGLTISAVGAQACTLQSSTGLVMMGPISLAAGVPFVLPPCEIGYGETAAGRSIMNQSDNATATTIRLTYQTYKAT